MPLTLTVTPSPAALVVAQRVTLWHRLQRLAVPRHQTPRDLLGDIVS